ncbi:hypothetical protein ACFO1B_03865 [Dactylosporangium siamense]|uniref:C2H2-type domain-containing protein n=1 Tax=Dactylosporangium siamense TaxID=685454 RepID=A0A919PI48_9ACTN|nr:hypothetical protein [Dactylosporangium siamense]GIG42980.1 hypothetical protein Dsi01nite_010210 [Dactylosporangium siamense]
MQIDFRCVTCAAMVPLIALTMVHVGESHAAEHPAALQAGPVHPEAPHHHHVPERPWTPSYRTMDRAIVTTSNETVLSASSWGSWRNPPAGQPL